MVVTKITRLWHSLRNALREGAEASKNGVAVAVAVGVFTSLFGALHKQYKSGDLHVGNIGALLKNLSSFSYENFMEGRKKVKRGITGVIWMIPVWATTMFLVAAYFGRTAEIGFSLFALLLVASRLFLNGGLVFDTAFVAWLFSRPLGYELEWAHVQKKGLTGKFKASVPAGQTAMIPQITSVEVEGEGKFNLQYTRPFEDSPFNFAMVLMLVLMNYSLGIFWMDARWSIAHGGLGLLWNIIVGQFGWILAAYIMHRRTLDYYKWLGIPDALLFLGTAAYAIFGGVIHRAGESDGTVGNIIRAQEYQVEHSPFVQKHSAVLKSFEYDTVVTVTSADPFLIRLNADSGTITGFKVVAVEGMVCWNHQDPPDCSGPNGANWLPAATGAVASGRMSLSEFFAPNLKMGSVLCSLINWSWSRCVGFGGKRASLWVQNANQPRAQTGDDTGFRMYHIEYTVERRYNVMPDGKLALAKM